MPIMPISVSGAMPSLLTMGQHNASASPPTSIDFGRYISNLVGHAVQQGASAESTATTALAGGGNLTGAVTAVAQAQLALQTSVALRDRMVSAYQSIMNMPI